MRETQLGALALLIVSAIVPTRYRAHVEIVLKPPPASIQFAVRASMGFGAYAHHVSGCCIPAVCSRFMVFVHFSRINSIVLTALIRTVLLFEKYHRPSVK